MEGNGHAALLPEEEDESSESSTDDSSTGSEAVTDEGSGEGLKDLNRAISLSGLLAS